MLFYAILLFLSAVGMLIIARRDRELFYASDFSRFMEVLKGETAKLWHAHLRERTLVSAEKSLRIARLWFIKTENKLYKATKFVRGIKEKGNGTPEEI